MKTSLSISMLLILLTAVQVSWAAEDVDVSGQWTGTWSAQQQYSGPCRLELVQRGQELTGTVHIMGRPVAPSDFAVAVTGTMQGGTGEITFVAPIAGSSPRQARYELRLAADGTLIGSEKGGFFSTVALRRTRAPSASVAAAPDETLTNDAVIAMVKGGLGEGLIIAKIRSTPSSFDLRSDALVAMKQAGVSDSVLEVMMTAGAKERSGSGAQVDSTYAIPPASGQVIVGRTPINAPPRQVWTGVYHLDGDNNVELKLVWGKTETERYVLFHVPVMVFPKPRAAYRISERAPVFFTPSENADVLLVRLKPGKEDRNLPTIILKPKPLVGREKGGPPDEFVVKTVNEPHAGGGTRIRPIDILPPGEYGFMLNSQAMHVIAEFGVD